MKRAVARAPPAVTARRPSPVARAQRERLVRERRTLAPAIVHQRVVGQLGQGSSPQRQVLVTRECERALYESLARTRSPSHFTYADIVSVASAASSVSPAADSPAIASSHSGRASARRPPRS